MTSHAHQPKHILVAVAWPYALLLAVGLFVLIPKLGAYGFWDPWEPKYAESVREMVDRGSYFVPYYRDEVRLARQIERGQRRVLDALARSIVIEGELRRLGAELEQGLPVPDWGFHLQGRATNRLRRRRGKSCRRSMSGSSVVGNAAASSRRPRIRAANGFAWIELAAGIAPQPAPR